MKVINIDMISQIDDENTYNLVWQSIMTESNRSSNGCFKRVL